MKIREQLVDIIIITVLVFTIGLILTSCGKQPKAETSYIAGPIGPQGPAGKNTIAEIAPSVSCSSGGVTILFGLDNNSNNIIDAGDTNLTSAEVCNGNDGLPGLDAILPNSTPVAILNPCGDNPTVQDEVLLKLADGTVLTSFSDNTSGKNTRFSILYNGTYTTTDGDTCMFILTDGVITYESH